MADTTNSVAPPGTLTYDIVEIVMRILKYLFEGIVVALAAYVMPGKKMVLEEVLVLGAVAATTFAILDLFAPSVGAYSRMGVGFSVGSNLVGGISSAGMPGVRN